MAENGVQDRFRHGEVFPDTSESARRIVPVLIDLIGVPEKVVDVGGGLGAWSRVFLEQGTRTVTCIDDPQVDARELMIAPEAFLPWDLSRSVPEPVEVDLAVCIEVAEHLPPERGRELLAFLVACAPVVLFSAAIPGQPGHGHIHEEPAVFWKRLFAELGYEQLDVIRPKIIGDPEIPYWYRQNLFVYSRPGVVARVSRDGMAYGSIPDDFELVHESLLKIYRQQEKPIGLRKWLCLFPAALRQSLAQRWGRIRKP